MRLTWLAAAIFSMALGVIATEDPFTGNWRLNLAKSSLPPPLPRSQTGRIEVQGESIQIREDVLYEDGKTLHIAVDAKFDGEFYPVTGTPFADSAAYRRPDSRTITGMAKKDGQVVSEETVVLAPDGRSMTVTYTSKREGKPATSVGVFDKE
ncbi:MAG TPA: hypothetical protein VMH81_24655 [Bryobacteraceae bacterium]|nr:hypothetical protein [Bryobacteraceae bacterium]